MNLKHLTDDELLKAAQLKAATIREHTLGIIDILSEINHRKLYADLTYSSLFQYIVKELAFSESQAAVYNNIIKSGIHQMSETCDLIKSGELTLYSAGLAAGVIKDNQLDSIDKKNEVIHSFKNLGKEEAQKNARDLTGKVIKEPLYTFETLKLSKTLKSKIDKLKQKLNLPPQMELTELVELLIDEKIQTNQVIQENKTITPKTKRALLINANHHCQFKDQQGNKCQETKYLEVEHIHPKSLGGSNHPDNLRIFCRSHNLRSAIKTLGQHSIFKRHFTRAK